ncbi:TetR/AcrR family transcriptional regulator [Hamadaea tsunoensis]|uniref:TetR/AcrR family transcriptional regulator n=1 Tax=Hamadaea tsunoensis TaxID=53368 RepID=UPI000551EEA6|nr:TetR/AcrR family transcriptional regulator [Hamadaea tsunoensis]
MSDPAAQSERPLRADARRNRQLVLEAAAAAFSSEGPGVSVQEIARRAGVGTGTVSRHFPTKDALFQAIVLDRIERCVGTARTLAETMDPAAAFFAYFAYLAQEGAVDQALAEALVGGGFDIVAAAARSEYDFMGALGRLLTAAQRAGAVRPDVDVADIQALVAGCLARERGHADPAARQRMIAIARDGLLVRPAR